LRRRANETKLAAHGIAWAEVEEVVAGDRWVPASHPDYPDQVRIIGPTLQGRLLTIALQGTDEVSTWRPVTGWESDHDEVMYYQYEAG